ncbi:hypothetical protein RB595_003868 [Gaeumannomyces hyphopodioides]
MRAHLLPNMNSPFSDNYAQRYFDNIQIADMEGHSSGTTAGLGGFEARQLPLLQLQTQWPPYSLGDHSAASGSASVDASGSEFGFADPASWSNTPHPQSDSPLLHNTTLPSGYTNVAGAGGAFAMDQYPATLDLSVPPQQLAPEDLDGHHRAAAAAAAASFEITPVGPTLRAESHFSFPMAGGQDRTAALGHGQGHARNGSSVSLPINLVSASPSHDCDDEEDGSPGRRKRPRRSDPSDGGQLQQSARRFACPYQVADPSLDCFHTGRRNRLGGCQSIYRLRQHFKRRHRRSHRCETCWKSFERAELADKHREKGGCKPVNGQSEMFMTPEQEKEVEKSVGSRSEEECWWDIFRVLIDGETDLATLQARYSAYYLPNSRELGIMTQAQSMLPTQQFGHPSSHQFDMMSAAGLMDQPFMLTDAQFELQSASQDTITMRHGGGIEGQSYGDVDTGHHHNHHHQPDASAVRTHLGRIRELVSMGLDDQASACESLAQIRAILPALEESIR